MATKLSDEQYGRFCAVNDDFRRRVREGEISFENALEIMRRAIRGQGYLGNQIIEGDDISLVAAVLSRSKVFRTKDIALILSLTGSVGDRYDRVPRKYRIIAAMTNIGVRRSGENFLAYQATLYLNCPTSDNLSGESSCGGFPVKFHHYGDGGIGEIEARNQTIREYVEKLAPHLRQTPINLDWLFLTQEGRVFWTLMNETPGPDDDVDIPHPDFRAPDSTS